jgi:cyclic pyranopterin phosphate synthase
MPAEGMEWMPRESILTFEEIERLAALMVERLGITSIRLTGGEPLVRSHLAVLVSKLSALGVDLSMTTNASRLASSANDLAAAGLNRVNISLDSLRRDRFARITGRDDLDSVLDGIRAAIDAGLEPVKLNVVAMAGVNDDELVDFADFGRRHSVLVRFIEFMPLDATHDWLPESVLSQKEILDGVGRVHPLEPVARGHSPAQRFRYLDGGGEIGVIPSVTAPFCGDCDRVRLTAEGSLRNCLFATEEAQLRALLRSGADDDALESAIRSEVARKAEGHAIGQATFVRPRKSMSQIGG